VTATLAGGVSGRAASRGVRLLLGLVGSSVWFGACVIPERTYDADLDPNLNQVIAPGMPAPNGADAGIDASPGQNEVSGPCAEYCSTIMSKCVGAAAVYASADECLAVCRRLPEGEPGALDGNSVQCRLGELRRSGFEPIDCADVGPISVDETCGEPCQTFCELQSSTCGDTETAYCASVCRDVLPKGDTYDVRTFANTDTLQCRVNNLVRAAESGPNPMSCLEARVAPTGQEFSCQDGPTFSLSEDRAYYCSLMAYSCRDDDAVYDDVEQCLAVSALFETGAPDAFGNNTLRCRRLHAYFSLGTEKALHCRHAGPTGDGGCGDNCDAFCRIARQGCPGAFEDEFGSVVGADPHTACVESCSGLPDAGRGGFGTGENLYSVNTTPPPGTLKCRTLNAVRALATPDDPQLCTAAFGAADSPCAALN
jgi:hypothetical protein